MSSELVQRALTLCALIDLIIPADDFPSGVQVGVSDCFQGILATDVKESADLVQAGLARLDQEAQTRYSAAFADLV